MCGHFRLVMFVDILAATVACAYTAALGQHEQDVFHFLFQVQNPVCHFITVWLLVCVFHHKQESPGVYMLFRMATTPQYR